VDGLEAAPIEALETGAVWSWHGEPVRVDGPTEYLRLDGADGEADIRKRAARMVRRLVGAAVEPSKKLNEVEVDEPLMESSFVVTNGARSYTVTLIDVPGSQHPLLMFVDDMPPRGADLWVVHHSLDNALKDPLGPSTGGVICFTPGTLIETPFGPRPIEGLREGDRVMTKDNGVQDIMWVGSRRMSGARLFAMPKLRPIRIRTGALGIECPERELIVSPAHRIVIEGAAARALFNTPEVLVSAKELVNGNSVAVDYTLREVTYIHLMLPGHEILWANGVETESFHPANTALSTLEDKDRARLMAMRPELKDDPHNYGAYARRNLSSSEAAILRYEAA
jgi:hypothetical protein